MSTTSPAVAVIGAGAIGGIVAAFLARAGHDPQLVCKHAEVAELAASPGLTVVGVRGQVVAPVRAVRRVDELAGPLDVVFLATKATDMLEAARDLQPLLGPESVVVSLQNGLCEPALAEVLGQKHVVGCVVGFGATMLGPARLDMTSTGDFILGELTGSLTPRLETLTAMLGSVVPTHATENIMGALYGKLIINSCITTLGGVCGLYLGEMLARRDARDLFLRVMREAMAVADAMGLKVEPGAGGRLDYHRFLRGSGPLCQLRMHLMLRLMGLKYRRLKSSMLQSLERGRPSEIDYMNGYICARGREVGVPTPANDALVALIRDIEAGRRPIAAENLRGL